MLPLLLFASVLGLTPSTLQLSATAEGSPGGASGGGADEPGRALLVDRGESLSFMVPADEALHFEVIVDVPLVGEASLGTFDLLAGTEPYRPGLAQSAAGAPSSTSAPLVGWARGLANGSCLNYVLDHEIHLRLLPQLWPRAIYRDTQRGTENRRRELMYGVRKGQASSLYRRDWHCKSKTCTRPEHRVQGTWPLTGEHHCPNCRSTKHRDWRKPTVQEVPADAVDMLSAIFLARAMVSNGLAEIRFPMLDDDHWWDVVMSQGSRKRIRSQAGVFDCRAVKFSPNLPTGDEEKFEGLFGIHGTLAIWLEERSGVPVSIEGVLPAGPLDVKITLLLVSYRGTPDGFGPVEK